LDAGRKVYLCTSNVGRIPRRYRGKDVVDWLIELGFYNLKTEDADAQTLKTKVPQVSGVGEYGHTVSLQSLAERGATILGKVDEANGTILSLQPNAVDHVKFGDAFSKRVKNMIDAFIQKNELEISPADFDAADTADETSKCASSLTQLNLLDHNIRTLIWTTGFGANLSYLRIPCFNSDGIPKHQQGISDIPGLYFIGFPWLRTRKSGIILGIQEDAEFIASKLMSEKGSSM